jgi:hypothetical protein
MPVHPIHTLRAGSTGQAILVYAEDPARPGTGRAGLSAADPGARAAYYREGSAVACPIRLAASTNGASAPGDFFEIDPERMPGVYRLRLPDEVLAPGPARVVLALSFPGAVLEPVEIALVSYDPQDEDHIGLGALDHDYHERVLRRAMPGLAKLELDLWKEQERRRPSTG